MDLGERLTGALVSGDFELYSQVMDLPLRIEPREGDAYTIHDLAALQQDFEIYHRNIGLHRITDIHRDITTLDTANDSITVIARVNMLSGATRVVDPFDAVFHLHRTADGWRFHRIQSSPGHINWTLGKGGIENGSFT